jgi:hypothetical protein
MNDEGISEQFNKYNNQLYIKDNRLVVYVPKEAQQQLKSQLCLENKTMSEFFREIVNNYLSSRMKGSNENNYSAQSHLAAKV